MNMKRKHITQLFITIFVGILLLSTNTIQGCTGFVVGKNEKILIAHNKDWWSPDTYIHTYPATESSHGRLFFEIPYPHIFNGNYMVLAGGFNDQGLCYESFVTPYKLASFELLKPPLFKNPVDFILQEYTTVEEVIDFIQSHNLFFLNYILCSGQLFVVDKTGDAAIIEGDDIIRIQEDYHICTNFLQSSPELGNYPCWRYEYLKKTFENITEISIPLFEQLLSDVELFTQYSWIYNPNNSSVNLYHYHDFNKSITINLTEEFNQPAHSYYLPSLFEPEHNSAPKKPLKPTGPTSGNKKTEYIFKTNTTDDDNSEDELYYKWNFGDGIQTYWIHNDKKYGGMISHTWKKPGTYQIKVKARDIYGKESQWSDPLEIHIPWKKQISYQLFTMLFNRV